MRLFAPMLACAAPRVFLGRKAGSGYLGFGPQPFAGGDSKSEGRDVNRGGVRHPQPGVSPESKVQLTYGKLILIDLDYYLLSRCTKRFAKLVYWAR